MKKVLATILALVMALGLCSVSWADADLPQADGNGVITLTDDVVLTAGKEINKEGTTQVTKIDLGGRKLSRAGGFVLDIYGDVTITNGTIEMTGAKKSGSAIWINNGAKVTIDSSVEVRATGSSTGETSFAIALDGSCDGAALTFNGTITGENGVTINGNIAKNTNKISVNGTIDVTEHALYLAGNGTTDINNGASLKGDTGVEIRAGVLNINGGTITSTGANYKVTSNPGGATTTGAALAVAEHTTNQGVTVNINGGTITNAAGGKAISMANPEEKEEAKGANVSVNGGTISGDVKVGENVKSTVEGKEPLTVSGDYNMTKDSEGNYTIAKKPTSYYYYSPSTTTSDTTTKGSPKTFDAGVGIYAVTAVLSVTGMAWTAKKRGN